VGGKVAMTIVIAMSTMVEVLMVVKCGFRQINCFVFAMLPVCMYNVNICLLYA